MQEASLTGESEAVLKDAAALNSQAPLAERRCMVFKGTAVVQGTGRAVITATGMQTEMGAIATMLDATVEQQTPLQKEVALIGRMLGIAVVVIAVIVVATVLLVSDIKARPTSLPCCCWEYRWQSRRFRKVFRPFCLSCWRWASSAWPNATPWSRHSRRWRPSARPPSSALTRPAR